MKKALITGMNGFVGKYLQKALQAQGYTVAGTYLPTGIAAMGADYYPVDLLKPQQIAEVIQAYQPDEIYHLAGQSSVALSWAKPAMTIDINVNGTINLLEAVRQYRPDCKVLIIGSSDEYGPVAEADCPVAETQPLNPVSPYGISKLTQEKMAQLYATAHHMAVLMVRPFNHIGPGQGTGFVVADFASRIADIEKGKTDPVLYVGNLHSYRDFTDVEDVVAAYILLMQCGTYGEVYNVGSGKALEIQSILEQLLALSTVEIKVEIDQSKYRPVDVPLVVCDNTKLVQATGWAPQKPLQQTLLDTLNYWREQ